MAQSRTQQGERRVLTLLFSDLVGSAELAAVLDAEDLREIYQQTREIAFAAVDRFGGKVKEYIGDGIVAYFGFPTALERGAQAAVNAGLEMVREIALRRWPLVESAGHSVRMRVGVHTGEVVIGDIGKVGGAHEPDAFVGTAPIVANRLQAAAAPNSVAISRSTFDLVRGQFVCRELIPVAMRGVAEPLQAFEVVAPAGVKAQIDRIATRSIRPLVGRAAELGRLQTAWQRACAGAHPGVCVKGEAGIGKSRLMAELKANLRAAGQTQIWEFQCSPYQSNTSWFAVAETLREQVCAFAEDETDEEHAAKLQAALHRAGLHDPVHLWLVSELLGLPHAEAELAAALAPEARKRRLMESLALLFQALSGEQAALYDFNDAHWIDASTAEWLCYLRGRLNAGGLVTLTTRPDSPAVEPLVEGMDVVTLGGLGDADVEALARSVAGGRILPHEIVDHIARNCSGVPLFVEEMTAALLASGAVEERGDHYVLNDWQPARQLPFSLRDLLQSRLDQLAIGEREVVQVCAVIGSEVTPQFVA
ncbi:MAG TPA: AAA family ATPase, partial [Chthoniobacteraceae bacterium]|nr:AAA family ATPase [Chthoniobacteraceae bacterium]